MKFSAIFYTDRDFWRWVGNNNIRFGLVTQKTLKLLSLRFLEVDNGGLYNSLVRGNICSPTVAKFNRPLILFFMEIMKVFDRLL